MEKEHQQLQLLTFSVKNENYGISILKVREVIGMMDIIKIPKAPQFIKGIINLRGDIIPVMDLRIKFGMEQQEYNDETCIIITNVVVNNLNKLLGIIIDRVSEVITVPNDEICEVPQYSLDSDNNAISGIGKVKGTIVIILDIDKVIYCENLAKTLETIRTPQDIKEIEYV